MIRRPPRSTLLPSTPLFRSADVGDDEVEQRVAGLQHVAAARQRGVAVATGEHEVVGDDAEGVARAERRGRPAGGVGDRKSTRLNSSHANRSYAVFCVIKKNM